MDDAPYRIDWARPVAANLPGERSYHATNGARHLLVIVSERQLLAADLTAKRLHDEEPDYSVQHAVEAAIARGIAARPLKGGELRLADEDFD